MGAIRGGGRCTPFFFKASLSFLVFFMLVLVRSGLFYFILYIYIVIINSDAAHDERVCRSVDLMIALHLIKGNHDICNFYFSTMWNVDRL